jgi:hypothetical protein
MYACVCLSEECDRYMPDFIEWFHFLNVLLPDTPRIHEHCELSHKKKAQPYYTTIQSEKSVFTPTRSYIYFFFFRIASFHRTLWLTSRRYSEIAYFLLRKMTQATLSQTFSMCEDSDTTSVTWIPRPLCRWWRHPTRYEGSKIQICSTAAWTKSRNQSSS